MHTKMTPMDSEGNSLSLSIGLPASKGLWQQLSTTKSYYFCSLLAVLIKINK